MTEVVVVGGGVAGMAAAHRLQGAGVDVVLLEKQDRLGGVVETTIDDGFLIEGGPDSFVVAKGSVLQLATELGLGEEMIRSAPESQGALVWWDGRLHPLPDGLLLMVPSRLGPFLRSSLLSRRGKLRALADLVLPRSRHAGDESLGSFVRRRLGEEMLDRIAEPLVAGIHAADTETMSLRASLPRFLDIEAEYRSLILAARRLASRADSGEGGGHFASFRLGMGQLMAALSAALESVEVRTGVAVVGLEKAGEGFAVRLGDGERIFATAIVLAVPAPVASRLLQLVSTEASDSISGIDQVANQAVTFAFRTDQLPPLSGSGLVVPRNRGPDIRGISFLSRKWAGRVPEGGLTLLRVFFPAGTIDDDPVAKALAGISAILNVDANPLRWWVRTHRQGMHRYTLGHRDRLARAARALESLPGIVLAGAGFHGVGLNECIASGWTAAESALAVLSGPPGRVLRDSDESPRLDVVRPRRVLPSS